MRCEVSGDCKLQRLVNEMQVQELWPKVQRGQDINNRHQQQHDPLRDHTSPAIARDLDKCVECGLCVAACGSAGQNLNIIGFAERGSSRLPSVFDHKSLGETDCISCGQCTTVCPTGMCVVCLRFVF